jgi:hypothetical protein
MYTGCTSDAHRMLTLEKLVPPVYLRCTSGVHPVYIPCTRCEEPKSRLGRGWAEIQALRLGAELAGSTPSS